MSHRNAIVIGSGVVGLATAIELLENRWNVQIVAENISPNTTSDIPGAIWEPYLAGDANDPFFWRICKASWERFDQLSKNEPHSYVFDINGFNYFCNPSTKPAYLNLQNHRRAKKWELPKAYPYGWVHETKLIEIPFFIQYLETKFFMLGGTRQIKKVETVNSLLDENDQTRHKCDMIVVCSGLGKTTIWRIWSNCIF